LKSSIEVVCHKCSGSEFQARGPAYENEYINTVKKQQKTKEKNSEQV